MMSQLSKWTPEMDACVAIGVNNGLSSRLIANELGVTRNAVIGRRFRLGLCKPKTKRGSGTKLQIEARRRLEELRR